MRSGSFVLIVLVCIILVNIPYVIPELFSLSKSEAFNSQGYISTLHCLNW